MAWSKNGTTTLSSAGDDIDITSLTASDFNVFLGHILRTGNVNPDITFDNTTGNDYATRFSYNGGTDNASEVSQPEHDISSGGMGQNFFFINYSSNIVSKEKLCIQFDVRTSEDGAGFAPNRKESVWKKDTSTDTGQYTRIDINNSNTGDFDTGSNLTALNGDTTGELILTNVQSGSRFEATDTRKIYYGANPLTFEDDFSSDNWTDTGSNINVNTIQERLDFNGVTNNTNSASVYDLGAGNVSDTAWVLRFKYTLTSWTNPSSATNFIFIGISDLPETTASSASQDFIGFQTTRSLSGSVARELLDTDGSAVLGASGVSMDNPSIGTEWIEIVRTSATQATIKVFSDSTYSTQVGSTVTATVSSGTSGLRYIKVMNRDNVSNGGTLIGYIDDLKFYNGVTSTDFTWTEES